MKSNFKPRIFKRTCLTGEIIFNEGEPGHCAYLIESGKVEVITGENLQIQLNVIGPGALVGEMAILDKSPRSATVRALEKTVLMEISQESLSERLETTDPILRLLFQVLLNRFRTTMSIVSGDTGNDRITTTVQYNPLDQGLEKMRLENEMHEALERQEFEVYFQPILGIKEKRWAGFEGLVRWNHPQHGLIYPNDFIPVAEETNLIRPLGTWVLMQAADAQQAFCDARNVSNPTSSPLFIGVNVSARQISDPEFAVLLDLVSPECTSNMKLEITETLIVDYEETRQFIVEAKRRGFSLAMDDFGTGYSGFQQLLELDFDTVKIDQAFVQTMLNSKRSYQLVQSIVEIARKLNLSVVAEGVENKEQLEALETLEVDYAQGFLIGRAMPQKSVIQALHENA